MKELTANTDPTYQETLNPSRADLFFGQFLQDRRDLPFVYLILEISVTMLPLALLLFVPALTGGAWWLVLAGFLLLATPGFGGRSG